MKIFLGSRALIIFKENLKDHKDTVQRLWFAPFKSLQIIYFSFIHNYVKCYNIGKTKISKTKLQPGLIKRRHAIPISYYDNKCAHAEQLVRYKGFK